MHNFFPTYFTTLFVLYSIMLFSLLSVVIFVSLVVLTEKRIWKNYSHISWINGVIVLCVSLTNAAVFSLTVIIMTDFCSLAAKIETE
jgi:hypothetical protein